MHVHASPINPNAQLDALYAAERAAAKREAERTRKKLLEFASELSGDADSAEGCVVELGAQGDTQEQRKEHGEQGGEKQKDGANSEEDNSISDWA
jgi:hypothetical protein